ncbi:MAG: hypothetical protein M1358_05090 [Chloroflexi bacterium]|nr:hypothetical protein [Chloroflexota bacterium]
MARLEIYEKVYKSLSVEAEAELILRIAALAEKAEMSFGEYIRQVLIDHADAEEAKAKKE